MKLINTQTLANLLDVSPRTIYDWVYKKRIPYHKLGSLLRFSCEEIERWLKSNRVNVEISRDGDNDHDQDKGNIS